MSKDIHTTNIVGAWVPVDKDYDFENDFEAPRKLFWCKGPHGEGHWSNDELWDKADPDDKYGFPWFQIPDLKITHWAWVNGPKDEVEEETCDHLLNEHRYFLMPKEEKDRRPLEQIVTEANRKAVKKEIERIKALKPIDWFAKFKESPLKVGEPKE